MEEGGDECKRDESRDCDGGEGGREEMVDGWDGEW